ncbi:hypothetical protein N9J26_01115 [bacterium]|nr:hypothetical protein [bacterium]
MTSTGGVTRMINIIDIEASGLHADSYPIEIAVLIDGHTRAWLVKPEPQWTYWNDTAESIHGMTRDYLFEHGLPVAQVADELKHHVNGAELFSDAVTWDADWADTLFFNSHSIRNFCISSIYEFMTDEQVEAFKENKVRLAACGRYREHRAEEDVRLIHEAFVDLDLLGDSPAT